MLLLIACSKNVISHNPQRLGALIAPPQNVSFVRELVTVKLECDHFPAVMDNLVNLSSNLEHLQDLIQNSNEDEFTSLRAHWQWKLVNTRQKLNALHIHSPSSDRFQSRKKRGLFNFAGKIQSFLWGVATEDEVKEIVDRLDDTEDVLEGQAKVLIGQSSLLSEHTKQV